MFKKLVLFSALIFTLGFAQDNVVMNNIDNDYVAKLESRISELEKELVEFRAILVGTQNAGQSNDNKLTQPVNQEKMPQESTPDSRVWLEGTKGWTQVGDTLYPNSITAHVGIGTTSPGDWRLRVEGNNLGIYGSGSQYAVYGSSTEGTGVHGYSSGSYGVRGYSDYGAGVCGSSSTSYGVRGTSTDNAGVYGYSQYANGVCGESVDNDGVYGTSTVGNGVYGESVDNDGVCGYSDNDNGVYGRSDNSYGVSGRSNNSIGVRGYGATYDFYAAGPGTNYGPFTGAHEVEFSDDFPKKFKTGMIVSVVGETKIRKNDEGKISFSTTLPTVQLSDAPDDSKVFGVLISECPLGKDHWYFNEIDEDDRFGIANALGEGRVWVTSINGDINAGDYITTSAIAGYGQRQSDDLLHSYTLGKAIEDIDWSKVTETIEFNGKTYKAYPIAVVYTSG